MSSELPICEILMHDAGAGNLGSYRANPQNKTKCNAARPVLQYLLTVDSNLLPVNRYYQVP
jgi:hypothetical protein